MYSPPVSTSGTHEAMKLRVPSDPGAAVLEDEAAAVVAVAPAAAVVAVALELLELLELFELELHASSSAGPPITSAADAGQRAKERPAVDRICHVASWVGTGASPVSGRGRVFAPRYSCVASPRRGGCAPLVHRDPLGPAGFCKR